ncbi:hypothetical protein [Mesorhizobium shangrilense]|uniref:Uncharacterized protein n=1 Tax=Mesorhizobium shangrilense TaxID=460060 RepID=A0ABV2D7T8_9HYPH
MTFPIFASTFLLAAAALLALRSATANASRQSMVKVRSNQRRPVSTKTQG